MKRKERMDSEREGGLVSGILLILEKRSASACAGRIWEVRRVSGRGISPWLYQGERCKLFRGKKEFAYFFEMVPNVNNTMH